MQGLFSISEKLRRAATTLRLSNKSQKRHPAGFSIGCRESRGRALARSFYELENRVEASGVIVRILQIPAYARLRKSARLVSRRIRSGWALRRGLKGTESRSRDIREESRASSSSCLRSIVVESSTLTFRCKILRLREIEKERRRRRKEREREKEAAPR